MMTCDDSPIGAQMPPDWQVKIIHASLTVGDYMLTGSDAASEHYRKPQGPSVQLNLNDAAEADRIFKTLSEKGALQMPLQETFWPQLFSIQVDQFGTPWMINYEALA